MRIGKLTPGVFQGLQPSLWALWSRRLVSAAVLCASVVALALIVKEQGTDVKIPTDLLGITPLTYIYRPGGNLTAAVAPVCTELRKVINSLGVR